MLGLLEDEQEGQSGSPDSSSSEGELVGGEVLRRRGARILGAASLLPPPPPSGQPSSRGHRWALVLRVPLPSPCPSEHSQQGQEVSVLASQLPGWDATEPAGLPEEGQRPY